MLSAIGQNVDPGAWFATLRAAGFTEASLFAEPFSGLWDAINSTGFAGGLRIALVTSDPNGDAVIWHERTRFDKEAKMWHVRRGGYRLDTRNPRVRATKEEAGLAHVPPGADHPSAVMASSNAMVCRIFGKDGEETVFRLKRRLDGATSRLAVRWGRRGERTLFAFDSGPALLHALLLGQVVSMDESRVVFERADDRYRIDYEPRVGPDSGLRFWARREEFDDLLADSEPPRV